MDFKDQIQQLADKIERLKGSIQTEEATKNAFIMPFLQSLGYDVFNPLEVVPEMDCDLIKKKGEKIDYAIMKDGQPIILIECKHWQQDLNLHDNQLQKYFVASKAKFGLLTNGVLYRFYTDLEAQNIMDKKPFLEIDLSDLRSNYIDELKKFHKSYFDVDTILSSANELKYTGELKAIFAKEFANPTPDFVKYFAKQVYDGVITAKILEQFTVLVKKSVSNLISELIADRLKTALKTETKENEEKEQEPVSEIKTANVVTTDEEIEAFFIIKSILRSIIPSDRITYRDAQTYFAVFIDDNNRKPVCRLYLNSATNKQIAFIGEDKKEEKYKLDSLDSIYQYSDILKNTIQKYI